MFEWLTWFTDQSNAKQFLLIWLFVAFVGRFLLPRHKAARDKHVSQRSLRSRYKLQERTFMLRVPTDSVLVGKTLAEQGFSAAPHLSCVGSTREDLLEILERYAGQGIDRLVALRGDLPSGAGAGGIGDLHAVLPGAGPHGDALEPLAAHHRAHAAAGSR